MLNKVNVEKDEGSGQNKSLLSSEDGSRGVLASCLGVRFSD